MKKLFDENERDFCTALGELTMYVAALENLIRDFILAIIGNEDKVFSEIILSEIHFIPLCRLLEKVFKHAESNRLHGDELAEILKDIRTKYTHRNNFIHAEWEVITPTKANRRQGFKTIPTKIEEIHAITKEVSDQFLALARFRRRWKHETISPETKELMKYLALRAKEKEQK